MLLVGLYISEVTMEINVEIPQKIKKQKYLLILL
jgi:hypothetical protein